MNSAGATSNATDSLASTSSQADTGMDFQNRMLRSLRSTNRQPCR